MREHNFTTNRSARALSGGRTGLVGWAMPLVRADYFAAILSGALEAVYEQELRMVLCTTLHEHDREVSLLEQLADGTTDGGDHPASGGVEQRAHGPSGERLPVRRRRPASPLDEGIPAVSAAHRAGAKAATDHLLALGHRRIGHISGRAGWAATEERIEGYHTALAAAGVLPTSDLVVEGNYEAASGFAAANVLLDLPIHRPRSSRRTTTWPRASSARRGSAS